MHSTSTKPLNPFAPSFTPRPPPPPFPASLAPQSWPLPPPRVLLYPIFINEFPPPQQITEFPPPSLMTEFPQPSLIRRAPLELYKHNVVPLKPDDESKTTIMIKNIPYDCSRSEIINLLDNFCLTENDKAKNEGVVSHCAYDFIYLPIDFSSKRGRGFGFVNFTNARSAWKFFEAFHRTNWTGLNWSKKIEIVSAKLQGIEALVSHFNESVFECETDEFLPALFNPPRDGSGQAVELTVVGNRHTPRMDIAVRNNYRTRRY